ncbi:MBL fold metallo-hydrolase [Lactovum odontotermitis]
MKIAENVEMLEVVLPNGNIYRPTLTWDDKHLVLFDTSVPDSGKLVADAIKAAGFDASNLTDIIFTHQDIDHIGGARELLALAPNAVTYAHEVDAPFIEGQKTPTKLARQEARLAASEIDETDGFYQMLKRGFAIAHLPVDVKLKGGDVLDFCGGIETVFTPGHIPGHAAFYLHSSKLMVCGDAANIADGQLTGSNPAMTWDKLKAEQSLEKIKSYDMTGAITYHSGFLKF